MIDYTKILKTFYSDAIWTLNGDKYEGLNWLSDSPKPSKTELDSKWDSILENEKQEKAEMAANRETALAKLAALGLTTDDLSALGL